MPPQFKDPLWPEPPPDIWQGGRPLAPMRPHRPPPPPPEPEVETKEEKTYLVNPDLHIAPPPQADPYSGQPLGPTMAFDRSKQRQSIDELMGQLQKGTLASTAQGLQGSVFDTPDYAAVRQSMSAGGPIGAGVVVNPVNQSFQTLAKEVPQFAGALQKAKPFIEYVDKPASAFKRLTEGVTTGVTPSRMDSLRNWTAQMPPDSSVAGPVKRTWGELARLYQYNLERPGSTLQSIRPTAQEPVVTGVHEGLHSLYAAKNPAGQVPPVSTERARELLNRVLNQPGMDDMKGVNILRQYQADPQHGLVEALAQFIANKAKHGMQVR